MSKTVESIANNATNPATTKKPKLISYLEFLKLGKQEWLSLLQQHTKIKATDKTPETNILDIAINQLHGIIFIYADEEIKDNKIVRIIKKRTKNYETCPNCTQKTLIMGTWPPDTPLYRVKTCNACSYTSMGDTD